MKLLNEVKRVSKYVGEDEDFWMEHVLKFSESGLSRAEYCRTKGINRDRFRYWKKIVEGKKSDESAEKSSLLKLKKLLPVEIKEEPVKKELGLCSIELRNGSLLQIHAWSVVEQILSSVLKCC